MAGIDAAAVSQYAALRSGVGIVPLPGRTLLEITGADRVNFIHAFCTNDVKRLQPGQGCEAFFTNHQGKTVGHGLIFAQSDSLVFESTPGQAPGLIQHLDRFVISERIAFHDRSGEWAELFVGGQQAGEMLKSQTGGKLPEALLGHEAVEIGGQPAVLRRVGFTQAPGWLVQVEAGTVEAVRAALAGGDGEEVGAAVFDACRLEAGWPWFGSDITDENLPQEIDRNEQAISFKKGCYLGQETVARLDALGHVNRLLVGLRIETAEMPSPGTKVSHTAKEVGFLTSVAASPGTSSTLALALVRRTAAAAGNRLEIPQGTAEIIKLPMT